KQTIRLCPIRLFSLFRNRGINLFTDFYDIWPANRADVAANAGRLAGRPYCWRHHSLVAAEKTGKGQGYRYIEYLPTTVERNLRKNMIHSCSKSYFRTTYLDGRNRYVC